MHSCVTSKNVKWCHLIGPLCMHNFFINASNVSVMNVS